MSGAARFSGGGGRPTPSALDVELLGMSPLRLEDLVDREALKEMAQSFEQLFGIPVRILSNSGMLADAASEASICAYVNETTGGRRACASIVNDVKALRPDLGASARHACFTGAVYRVIPIHYDHRALGRIVIGPYMPAPPTTVPDSLTAVDAQIDAAEARRRLPLMSAADDDRVERMSAHLRSVLDVVLFSGHKSLLTSKMHLASINESYRELQDKTDKLEEAYERLKELDRLKSNFLATVSHELRTPLTSIMGYGEMLAEGIAGELTTEQSEFVQTIRVKSEQLLGLIMSLLDLSKLESGTASIRRGEVSISMVLAETISTLAPTAAKKGVQLRADATPELPSVSGDADRLRQVFVNLTENAIKFTPSGGTVTLVADSVTQSPSSEEQGLILVAPLRQAVEVRVLDTGIGIPESERARVFDPFYQIDQSSTREHGGTGLGLSIVKRLVEAHHGTVHIEPNEPRGAVFVVTLPVVRASFPPPGRKSVPPPGHASIPPALAGSAKR